MPIFSGKDQSILYFIEHFLFDIGLNIHQFKFLGNIKWENDSICKDDGTKTWLAGPAVYLRINDTVHGRLAWKKDIVDKQGTINHGNTVRVGIGFVY